MDDSDAYGETLRHTIMTLRLQLMLLAIDDPRRGIIYQDLLWCYHEAMALVWRRIAAYRAVRGPAALSP